MREEQGRALVCIRGQSKKVGLSGGFKTLRGMAMGAVKGQAATLQIEMVCLDELVPVDDRLRRLDALVDWGFVRAQAAPYYVTDVGRPSIDPIVLVKLMLVGALEGIDSMRELLRVAALRVDIRRFLGYGFAERLPVHQTISHAQTRRFVDAQLFERLFLRSVALCREHGLIDGTHLSVDGFHVEANAALASLRASLEPVAGGGGDESSAGEGGGVGACAEAPGRPQLSLAEPRSGPTPKRRSSNATSVSLTDPDAKLRGKPGQRPHLVHRGQVAVDPKARCVVACLGEQADGHEGDALVPILERARFACRRLSRSAPTRGSPPSVSGAVLPTPASRRSCRPSARCCPPTMASPRPTHSARRRPPGSAARPRPECGRTSAGWPTLRARSLNSRTSTGSTARAVAAPRSYHAQLLLGCTALNFKRLASHVGEAASGAAARPLSGRAIALDAHAGDPAAHESIHHRSITPTRLHGLADTRMTVPTWTITLSMN